VPAGSTLFVVDVPLATYAFAAFWLYRCALGDGRSLRARLACCETQAYGNAVARVVAVGIVDDIADDLLEREAHIVAYPPGQRMLPAERVQQLDDPDDLGQLIGDADFGVLHGRHGRGGAMIPAGTR